MERVHTMINNGLATLFHVDELALVMMALVGFIGLCVASFAYRYLKGDTRYSTFFVQLGLLVLSVAVMVSADNFVLLFGAWCTSNLLLVRLMVHKESWRAAKASGLLATRNYALGAATLATAFGLFFWATGVSSVNTLIQLNSQSPVIAPALVLLFIAAMTQSAIWPFHRWLTSSLNSPTPVSAIMHAGLVNGGGFLLVRFAPLYLQHSTLLTALFALGLFTALLGTLWKLMQSDVKRMLACSTMSQMGFMLAQCGLGLFPAAVAHLVWHGMFKAYLFLASGGAARENRFDLGYPPKPFTFALALICGFAGTVGFAYTGGTSWIVFDTRMVLNVVAFLAAAQFALPMLREKALIRLPFAVVATSMLGAVYGGSVHLITDLLAPMNLMQPQPLNIAHIVGMIALTLAWLSVLFAARRTDQTSQPDWLLKGYVMALNSSQPHPETVTSHRNHYKYL